MRKVDNSIHKVSQLLLEMWTLVQGQVERASKAFLNNDTDAAHEVLNLEKKVDSYELIIDHECENFFALLTPVAIDMRLIVSILKINNDLERIGDFAYGLSKTVLDGYRDFVPDSLLADLKLPQMFEEVQAMLAICKEAYIEENSVLTSKVFAKDDEVDAIFKDSIRVLADYLKEEPTRLFEGLNLNIAIRRIERIGDRCDNIAENIVFYLEAKVLKHQNNEV